MRENEHTCSICGAILTEETMREFDGQLMCVDCFHEHATGIALMTNANLVYIETDRYIAVQLIEHNHSVSKGLPLGAKYLIIRNEYGNIINR